MLNQEDMGERSRESPPFPPLVNPLLSNPKHHQADVEVGDAVGDEGLEAWSRCGDRWRTLKQPLIARGSQETVATHLASEGETKSQG